MARLTKPKRSRNEWQALNRCLLQTFTVCCLLRYDITLSSDHDFKSSYLNPVAVMKPEIVEFHRELAPSWVRVANVVNTLLKKNNIKMFTMGRIKFKAGWW